MSYKYTALGDPSFPMWQPSDELTLVWCNKPLGVIRNLTTDQPWMRARFAPNTTASEFRAFFDACTDDPPDNIASLFDSGLFEDANWSVVKSDGTHLGIRMPVVQWSDGDISWLWNPEA